MTRLKIMIYKIKENSTYNMHFVHIHGTFLEVVMLDPEKCTYKICIAPTKFTTVYILVYFF